MSKDNTKKMLAEAMDNIQKYMPETVSPIGVISSVASCNHAIDVAESMKTTPDTVYRIRLTQDELSFLKSEAKNEGTTLSSYMRKKLGLADKSENKEYVIICDEQTRICFRSTISEVSDKLYKLNHMFDNDRIKPEFIDNRTLYRFLDYFPYETEYDEKTHIMWSYPLEYMFIESDDLSDYTLCFTGSWDWACWSPFTDIYIGTSPEGESIKLWMDKLA